MLQGLPVYKRLYEIILLTTHSENAEISLEKVENISVTMAKCCLKIKKSKTHRCIKVILKQKMDR